MARDMEMPDAIEKRNILAAEDADPGELIAIGQSFLEKGSLTDAINFFDKAGNAEGLERVKARAIEEGIAAALFGLTRSRHVEITDDDWRAVAKSAVKQEKFSYAAQAYRRLGDEERLAEMLKLIPGAPQPEDKGNEEGEGG